MFTKISFTFLLLIISIEFAHLNSVSNDYCLNNQTSINRFFLDCSGGSLPDKCCSYWTNKVTANVHSIFGIPFISYDFSCSTGGDEQCILGECNTEVEVNED